MTESEILHKIRSLPCSRRNSIAGDDIAAFKTRGAPTTYAATDSLIENVHYRRDWLTPSQIAFKLFARNWSDFICKGIRAEHALLNLNLSRASAQTKFVAPFLRELDRLFTKYKITLIGGDTSQAGMDVFTLTFIGTRGKFVGRRNASIRAGDLVLQLGAVGGSSYAVAHEMQVPRSLQKYFSAPQVLQTLPGASRVLASIDQSDSVAKSLKILASENKLKLCIHLETFETSHKSVITEDIPRAAEDLAVFVIAKTKPAHAFRVVGKVDSIREQQNPGVEFRLRGKTVLAGENEYEHFRRKRN